MKKIISILSAGLVTLFGAISCVNEDLTTFDETKATAPVLGSYELGEKALTATFTPGAFNQGFNQNMPVNHSLILASVDGKTVNKALTATVKDGQISVTLTNLAKTLVAIGCQEGDVVSLDMFIRASMQEAARDNGRNGYVDSQGHITLSGFEVVIPEVQGNPWEAFTEKSEWSLIGAIASTGNNWNKDETAYKTPDGKQHVVKNIKLTPDDQFKYRYGGSWDVNRGAPGDVEPFVVNAGDEVEATQNGKNLGVAVAGNYDILYDEEAESITISEAFQTYPGFDEASSWGVTGSIASRGLNWDKDVSMTTDGEWHVAEGVVLTKDDQFKFRNNQGWTENFGAPGDTEPFVVTIDAEETAVGNGKNLAVPEDGTYDLMVNPAAGLYKIVVSLGGYSPLVGEGGGSGSDEPSKPTVWSLIGTLNGTAWDEDFDMTNVSGDVWIARNVAVTESDEFKIRADHSWDTNVGGPEGNDHSTINPDDPYDVFKPVLGEPFEAKDKNIRIGIAGNYDITYDYAAGTILIEEHYAAYSLIGEIEGDSWKQDFIMTESGGVWTSQVLTISGGFKIRYDFSWDDANTFGVEDGFTPVVGTPFTAVQPGANITVPEEGSYKVQFNPQTMEVLIISVAYPETLYMIGAEFGAWDWNSDGVVEMTPVLHNPEWGAEAEGQFWTVRYFTADEGFKFCSKRSWGEDFWGLSTNEGFSESGGNCVVAEDGFYLVHVDFKREIVHVEPARIYGIGNCFGSWDEEMEDALFKADGRTLKATTTAEGEIRMYAASAISTSDWWTREFVFFDGKIAYRGNGGDQDRVTVLKGQTVSLDFNAGTASIDGEGEASALPETMYIIGEAIGGWDWDGDYIVDMTPVNGKAGQFWAIRYLEPGKGFKFCSVKEWNGDFTGLGEDSGYTVSDNNCVVDEKGVYMIYVDTDNKKLRVEKAKVYGIGDCFGSWDEGIESALFEEKDGKLVGKTSASGDIRLYASSSIATSDWWTREFVFFDGKIAYRGNGGDQDRVSVEAGKTVTLDFNAGTATVE